MLKLLTGGFQLSNFNFAGFKASADTDVLLLALKATGIFDDGVLMMLMLIVDLVGSMTMVLMGHLGLLPWLED